MLVFLRRIRKSLIESGSARKYLLYALGEIVLVVIGILIALQINNWNEWRKDRILEKEILSDLKINLENNLSIVSDRINYLNRGQHSTKIILNVLDNHLPYNDSLGIHFSQATRGYGGADVISYVGYETLRNNGFGLITNKLLRDEIIRLFENTYRTIISVDETFKLQNNHHQEIVSGLLYYDKPYSLKPFDFEELFKSKKYYSLVSDHRNNYQWMKEETIDALAETQRVLNLLKNEQLKGT